MNAHPRSANNGCQVQPDLAVRNLVNQSYRAGMCCRPKLARAFARRCAIGAGRPATNLRTRRCRAASFMTIATFLSCRDWGAARWRAFVAQPTCEGCRNVCRQPQSIRGACTRREMAMRIRSISLAAASRRTAALAQGNAAPGVTRKKWRPRRNDSRLGKLCSRVARHTATLSGFGAIFSPRGAGACLFSKPRRETRETVSLLWWWQPWPCLSRLAGQTLLIG
jgi:hypothetical protein